jgi:enoyl-CoA hydratase
METVGQFERREDAAWITIDRPERRNALSSAVIDWMRECLADAKHDKSVRAVVITGSGETNFSSGGDLKEMGDGGAPDVLSEHFQRTMANGIFADLQGLGKPTIARVRGLALAGGFGIALGCDFIIASDDAQFGLPEVRVGLWPYSITESLTQFVPPKVALQLMLTGHRISAAQGKELGFVYATAPGHALDREVEALLRDLRAASPEAVRLGKTTFYRAIDADPASRMALLEAALTINLSLPDAAEGIAAFAQRRSPAWIPTI